ncbi:synaptonemal complex protein 2 [Myripristis murdjan]|uniref:synaptonemal complex protein 2 n=1 Tax=Myripristis murdjan TaxID=586833 RepID=UPI00117649B6|nr:synaptonemal complex protein 2 [Myripristis murdjan]
MASSQAEQLEKLVDEVLKSRNLQVLDAFLQEDIHEEATLKCSKQFLTKLDKLVTRGLDQKDVKSASLGLTVICKYGKNLLLSGGQGLPGIITQGLVKKMLHWFEKCRQLWTQGGPQRDGALLNLSEDFFDSLMIVHEACKEATYEITESLLYPIGQLAADPRVYILIQKEAIRKFNHILDKIPAELKKEKKILSSQEASDVMIKLAGQILDCGDYDLQIALMEALCRMATPNQRKQLAGHWFSMEYVAKAFVKIRDSQFETDCRKFLNLVNGMQGDKRRVFSYPCLEVFVDKHELLMPRDENLEEFWIDFNLGSHSISFYFSLSDEEVRDRSKWDTLCISENEVQSYTVTEESSRHVLRLKLSELVVVGVVEGANLTIRFSSSLDILQAARRIFGHIKEKSVVGKGSTSVVKTSVKIVMEESNSQAFVPESQMSPSQSERNSAPFCLPCPVAPLQMVSPAKRRISESTYITSSAGTSVHGASPFSVIPSKTSHRVKGKTPLEKGCSYDRQGEKYLAKQGATVQTSRRGINPSSSVTGGVRDQSDTSKQVTRTEAEKYRKNIPLKNAVAMVLAEQGREGEPLDQGFVPDSQPTMKTERRIYSHCNKLAVSEMLMMPTQKINSLSKPGKDELFPIWPVNQQQFHKELTERLKKVFNERNQAPTPHKVAEPQGNKSEVREDSWGRGPADQCDSTWEASKEPQKQQAQRKYLTKESKDQKSVKADLVAVKAPAKAIPPNVLQERITPNLKVIATRPLSSKEKRNSEVAGSMVKLISSHYKSNTYSTAKATTDNTPPLRIPQPANKEDIFAFRSDSPFKIGGKDTLIIGSSALSSSGIRDSWTLPSTTKKGKPVAEQGKRYVKKHLFSDTDTDNAMTEVSWLKESSRRPKPQVAKYSRQAPPKTKPLLLDTTHVSLDLLSPPKPGKGKTKTSKKTWGEKKAAEQLGETAAASSRQGAAGRRPQRAAATTAKSYKEPDTDDSQSESEKPPASKVKKTKTTLSKEPTKNYRRLESSDSDTKQPPAPQECLVSPQGKYDKTYQEIAAVKRGKTPTANPIHTYKKTQKICQETANLNKKKIIHAKDQITVQKDSWAARLASRSPSPPSIERMRSAKRSAPTLDMTRSPLLSPQGSPLHASPTHPRQNTPSPILQLPKPPRSAVSTKGNFQASSFYNGEIKGNKSNSLSHHSLHSVTPTGQTPSSGAAKRPSAAEVSPIQQPLSSAPQSPLSLSPQPLLTSTALELCKASKAPHPQLHTSGNTLNYDLHYGSSTVSPVSQVLLGHSSTKSSVPTTGTKGRLTAALTHKMEKTPSSDRKLKRPLQDILGPSHKRHISHALTSYSEEEDMDEGKKGKRIGEHSARMRPRKLFKSIIKVSPEGGVSHVMSSSMVSSSHWESEVEDEDMDTDEDEDVVLPDITIKPHNIGSMCKQFSSEQQKMLQNRHRLMKVYSKQNLKTVQQHVSSINMQVNKYRTQKLEQIQGVLMEEIRNLEEDNTILNNMEKDLTVYWKKQSMAFRSYQEKGSRRYGALKNVFQNDVCHSLEYEERIFTSQMCLMRKDMKSIQDRLLSEMVSEEMQGVKRGLQALFLPEGARF